MADPNQNPYMNMNSNPMSQNHGNQNYHRAYEVAGMNSETAGVAPITYNTVELTTNGVCKKFIHGKCRQGQACPHPHDKSKIKACEKYESRGECPYGERCNFSHDLKICKDFIKQKCDKGEHCHYRHVYKSCPNFDMGFCHLGKLCQNKHIVRKLCWDYMYGYCQKGGRCADHHPKIFVEEDFKYTQILFQKLAKTPLQIIVCKSCKVIGHKVNKCPKRMQIQPTQVFKCGLCGSTHMFSDDCTYNN